MSNVRANSNQDGRPGRRFGALWYHTDSEDGQQILALAHGGVHLLSGQARLQESMRRLTIQLQDNGETLLTGPVLDQAALYGVLKKVRDVGIPLHAARSRYTRPGRGVRCQ